jgi:3-oxoacyl-[acyl-carrier protein] reductase
VLGDEMSSDDSVAPGTAAEEEDMRGLSEKVALVTGSSRGIGAAIAELFAHHGANVVLHGRDREALATVQARIHGNGGQVMSVTGDVRSSADLEAMRAQIELAFGPVDVLVANAGGSAARPGPIEDISEESWRADIDGNLTATFLTIKCFLPGMKERGTGSIITMSSAAARRAHAQTLVAYAAAKTGVQILTQDLAAQAGPYGVRVNCIAPEMILTEKNQLQGLPEEQQRALIQSHPLRRFGTAEDVARAALYLASDDASWVTGVVLDVNGGAIMAT